MKENYLVIQGWMVTELKLSSNNLLTYALIYGFSQDGENEFTGSINYLCKWLNCSRPTAIKSLKFLIENNLIIKNENIINGVVFNRYKISLWVVKKLNMGSKETLLGGSKETLPNNTTINNTNNNIDERKLKFAETIKPFLDLYGKETLLGGSKETLPNNTTINNTNNNIDERKLKFAETIKPFLDLYGKETCRDFYNYWTEPNKSNTKLNFELQKTWDVKRRLERWVKNDFNKKNNNTVGNDNVYIPQQDLN